MFLYYFEEEARNGRTKKYMWVTYTGDNGSPVKPGFKDRERKEGGISTDFKGGKIQKGVCGSAKERERKKMAGSKMLWLRMNSAPSNLSTSEASFLSS